jgi:hypothetical protein
MLLYYKIIFCQQYFLFIKQFQKILYGLNLLLTFLRQKSSPETGKPSACLQKHQIVLFRGFRYSNFTDKSS